MIKITKPFKEADLHQITQSFSNMHRALDWFPARGFLAYGTPLVTPEKVLITKIYGNDLTNDDAELTNGYGVWMLGQETGQRHLYWHTQPIILANVGDIIERNKIIAFVGNSGNVFEGGTYVPISERLNEPHKGTHLHQACINTADGMSFDPLIILDLDTEPTYTSLDVIKAYTEVLGRITKLVS